MNFLKKELRDYQTLLRKVPPVSLSVFVLSVVSMNLLANKEIFRNEWIALDCGFAFSWIPFIIMDGMCKAFGGKAAAKVSILAIAINLAFFCLFKLVTLTPGNWGEYYSTGIYEVNDALNATIGGSAWIVLGSAFAMLVSSSVNAVVNISVAKLLKMDGYCEFAIRSFTSTAVAQFIDNFTFALVVSIPLFGWNMRQTFFCSLTAALVELLLEVLFSGFGYKLSKKWGKE